MTLADTQNGPDWVIWAVFILIMELFEDVLPASLAGIAAMLIFADCLVMVILGNTICKKKNDRIDKRK